MSCCEETRMMKNVLRVKADGTAYNTLEKQEQEQGKECYELKSSTIPFFTPCGPLNVYLSSLVSLPLIRTGTYYALPTFPEDGVLKEPFTETKPLQFYKYRMMKGDMCCKINIFHKANCKDPNLEPQKLTLEFVITDNMDPHFDMIIPRNRFAICKLYFRGDGTQCEIHLESSSINCVDDEEHQHQHQHQNHQTVGKQEHLFQDLKKQVKQSLKQPKQPGLKPTPKQILRQARNQKMIAEKKVASRIRSELATANAESIKSYEYLAKLLGKKAVY